MAGFVHRLIDTTGPATSSYLMAGLETAGSMGLAALTERAATLEVAMALHF